MATRNASPIGCLLLCGCVSAAQQQAGPAPPGVALDNHLVDCLQVDAQRVSASPARLSFDYRLKDSLADCGCKSALASYRTQDGPGADAQVMIEGQLRLDGRQHVDLPLTDGGPRPDHGLTVVLGCARPA